LGRPQSKWRRPEKEARNLNLSSRVEKKRIKYVHKAPGKTISIFPDSSSLSLCVGCVGGWVVGWALTFFNTLTRAQSVFCLR